MVDGTLYVTSPDNAWALDARDGRELWHYFWKTRGGTPHRQPRPRHVERLPLHGDARQLPGVARREDRARSAGTRTIADFSQQYFSTIGADRRRQPRACVGTGNDLDSPGLPAVVRSRRPASCSGSFYTVPMKPGDPGLDTWPSLDAARHGGAQPWLPGVYDPETKLYIFGTGNPIPAYTRGPRRGRQPLHLLADRGATSIPARWPGTSRPRRTTCTTGIRRRRRS